MRVLIILSTLFAMTAGSAHAAQSVIVDAEGYACMGDDKSRKQTEETAVKDAKRNATESALTYIQSETQVKDMVLEKDLTSAYSRAQVKVLQELAKGWYKEDGLGDCYRAKLKAEVIPDEQVLAKMEKKQQDALESDPSAPLNVRLWTDSKDYRSGEKIKIFLKANKPFYGRLVYKDAGGNLVQLLPNPYRKNNYFNGGVVYELPSGDDRFDLEVSPPFGTESISLYAATSPVGEIEVTPIGGVYMVSSKASEVASGTRGVKLTAKGSSGSGSRSAAEFSEAAVTLDTGK